MSETISLIIDGVEVEATPGQTILEAAEAAGIYVPRLCYHRELHPYGACRVCTVLVNGRPQAACTQPVAPDMVVDNSSEKVMGYRKAIIEMLFVEGNHFCMFCEKSGNCELQALAYRFGIMAPRYPYQFPKREVDASHPDIFIDHHRCILCARCIRASRDLDGKHVFQFIGRSSTKKIGYDAEADLTDTDVAATDKALEICPVGALMRKRVGYAVPIGERQYDTEPIGSEVEAKHTTHVKSK
jgi:[NiFe] hydrogenase diaphorase moiety small subunit